MNVAGLFSGTIETPLTDTGRKQAKIAGEKAKNLGIDLIVASPLGRALETAQIIAKEAGYSLDKIQTNSLLIERHFGEMEGKAWHPDLNLDDIVDIETPDTLLARARKALDWLESLEADTILVVAHGAFGRALRHHVLEDFPFTHPSKLANAEIVKWL